MTTSFDGIPVIDISSFVRTNDEKDPACLAIAAALHKFGCLAVKDPRVQASANETFLDMMERYFEQSDGKTDARPHLHYQVGVTPGDVERARPHCEFGKTLADQPMSECPPLLDAKWRFFWRIGDRPESSQFEELNASPVVPDEFADEWQPTMDSWGEKLVDAAETVATMAAIGFGVEKDSFVSKMHHAPHLLAPTGSNLTHLADQAEEDEDAHAQQPRLPGQPIQLNTVLAGFHYDLNFLTVHGKSRFPGLRVWTRDGHVTSPKIPPGYLFMQAGKQFEYLTGGYVLAGFHEVVAHKQCAKMARLAKEQGKSTWRVSSTCFSHIASDEVLEPIPGSRFDTEESRRAFPPVLTGDQVQAELIAISLGQKKE